MHRIFGRIIGGVPAGASAARVLVALGVFATPPAAGAQEVPGRSAVSLDPGQPVVVTMSRGTIEVVGGTGNKVVWELRDVRRDSTVAVRTYAWNRALTYDGTLRIDITPPADAGVTKLDLRLTIPRSAKLLRLRLTAGDITVSGFDGDLEVESDSGDVRGSQLGGGIVAETRDGGIEMGVTTVSPKHAISLLARNAAIVLVVPANGMSPLSLTLPCSLGGVMMPDPRETEKTMQAFGMSRVGSGCDATSDRIETGAKVTQIGQQLLNGIWIDGGAAIDLRTLRGTIILRRK